jgi:methylthioribose-1-phosphate isomerase
MNAIKPAVSIEMSFLEALTKLPGVAVEDVARERLQRKAELVPPILMRANRRMGALGAALLPDPCTVIHHCNTGSLATVEYGTALGVVRAAHESGKAVHVLVGETRPMLQGARLTTWELGRLGVPHTLIVDGAAGFFLQQGRVDAVLVGADRIAANGDTANKIGTFTLAAAARACDVPFFVVAPTATVDLKAATGQHIPIECRPEEEVTTLANRRVAPIGTSAANPAFDIPPQAFVTAIVTEAGILRPPFGPALRDAAGQALGPFADGAALGPANGGEIHP